MNDSPRVVEPSDITLALEAYQNGQDGALERLVALVYGDLHRLAQVQLAKRRGQDLQTTALVHELYLKLSDRRHAAWKDRNHFYAACATAMRNILIDSARSAQRIKRGGGVADLTLVEAILGSQDTDTEWLIGVDQALRQIAEKDARLARVFELRYFGGYSGAETSEILDVSKRTVERDWKRACAWIRMAVDQGGDVCDGDGAQSRVGTKGVKGIRHSGSSEP